jgi:hypothetical protein
VLESINFVSQRRIHMANENKNLIVAYFDNANAADDAAKQLKY